jgi:Mg-chelatase subunit ChlD
MKDEDKNALLRWRLALGPGAERTEPRLALSGLGDGGDDLGLGPDRTKDLDEALSFVYEDRAGGAGSSRPYVPKWLASIREFFSHDVVALVQKDAMERRGLTQLLLEPETLPFLEKNVDLVATLITAKGVIPDEAKETAREIVREVVDELRKKLETSVRTSVIGAVRRDRHSPLKVAKNIDWKKTIRANLKTWDREHQRMVPERFHFFASQRRRHEWDVVLLVDQSGSMAESVVYASVMAAIFASLDVLRTRLLFFDTELADMTEHLSDPVEILFSAQLGGGTDINRAVAYAEENFLERPEKTLFILISDLFEGGDREALMARMRRLVESKVKVISLLALTDGGRPAYDHDLARQLDALGVHPFGCTPHMLVEVMEKVMRGG